jgi:Tol biopolymer transport system component
MNYQSRFAGLTCIVALAATAAVAMPAFGDWSAPANIETLPGSSTEVNSPSIDGCASISPDGLTLTFNSFRTNNQQIYLATRSSASEGFGDPVMLPAPINGPGQDFCPTLSQGKRLYFTSTRGDPGDLFVSRLGPRGWSEPQRLGTNINVTGMVEEAPTFYEDEEGREVMLFSRRAAGPLTVPGGKIYQSIDGGPATLVQGGPNGASSPGDYRPSVTHDGKTIFWDSLRTSTLGGSDIWYATRSSTSEPWGQAIHLAVLSTGVDDVRPYVSWDSELLIGASSNEIWFSAREKLPGN